MAKNSLERMNNLAESLLQRAKRGRLPWTSMEDENAYMLRGESGAVIVASRSPGGEHPYRMILLNPHEVIVEAVETIPGQVYHAWETRLADLYDVARASALNVDDVLTGFETEFGLEPVEAPVRDDEIPF